MNYLSCADVAKAMGVGIRRVQKMCKQGELPGALRMGHRWMIPKENVPPYYGTKRKPLPIGVSDFKTAVANYYYVDKTLLIRDFLDTKPMVSLFTRPRRFGKTLNMDMLRVFLKKRPKILLFISGINRYGGVVIFIPSIRENIPLSF